KMNELKEIFENDPPPCNCDKKNREWKNLQLFNMLFTTHYGPTQEELVYLRPETAQGIFINFLNVMNTMRKKLPLGSGQIGKAFRNEISPRDFLFRSREFEQMEIEYFCHPKDSNSHFNEWVQFCYDWLIHKCGIKKENLK